MAAIVLDFLTNTAAIELMDAAPLVQKFLAFGAADSKAIFALSKDDMKELIPNVGHRRKAANAIKRGEEAAMVSPAVSPKKKRKSSGVSVKVEDEIALEAPEVVPEEEVTGEVSINRSPVMILWAATVAHTLGNDWGASLSLAHTVSALNAQSKAGRIWGQKKETGGAFSVDGPEVGGIKLLGRDVPACRVIQGCSELKL